jgi:hypothetical protein
MLNKECSLNLIYDGEHKDVLSPLERMFDSRINEKELEKIFGFDHDVQSGKTYKVTIKIEEI